MVNNIQNVFKVVNNVVKDPNSYVTLDYLLKFYESQNFLLTAEDVEFIKNSFGDRIPLDLVNKPNQIVGLKMDNTKFLNLNKIFVDNYQRPPAPHLIPLTYRKIFPDSNSIPLAYKFEQQVDVLNDEEASKALAIDNRTQNEFIRASIFTREKNCFKDQKTGLLTLEPQINYIAEPRVMISDDLLSAYGNSFHIRTIQEPGNNDYIEMTPKYVINNIAKILIRDIISNKPDIKIEVYYKDGTYEAFEIPDNTDAIKKSFISKTPFKQKMPAIKSNLLQKNYFESPFISAVLDQTDPKNLSDNDIKAAYNFMYNNIKDTGLRGYPGGAYLEADWQELTNSIQNRENYEVDVEKKVQEIRYAQEVATTKRYLQQMLVLGGIPGTNVQQQLIKNKYRAEILDRHLQAGLREADQHVAAAPLEAGPVIGAQNKEYRQKVNDQAAYGPLYEDPQMANRRYLDQIKEAFPHYNSQDNVAVAVPNPLADYGRNPNNTFERILPPDILENSDHNMFADPRYYAGNGVANVNQPRVELNREEDIPNTFSRVMAGGQIFPNDGNNNNDEEGNRTVADLAGMMVAHPEEEKKADEGDIWHEVKKKSSKRIKWVEDNGGSSQLIKKNEPNPSKSRHATAALYMKTGLQPRDTNGKIVDKTPYGHYNNQTNKKKHK